MAFESGSQGSGLLGRVFSAIGASKAPNIRHIPLSEQGDAAYSNLFADYNKLLGNQTSGLEDFTKQYQSLTPQLAGLDQLHASTYGDLLKRAASYDPTGNLRSSGDYLFNNLDKYLKTGMDAGNAALKSNLAAAGYGDRGPGGYAALLNANRITGNLLPAFSNIVSNLTPLTNQQGRDYFQNIAIQPALMQGQNASLEATPYRNLVPAGVQQDLLRGNRQTIDDLVKSQLNNWVFYNKPNAWTTAGNVASGIYGGLFDAMDVLNKAGSTYGNLMGSGLGGQMGIGKMSGAEAPTNYPQSTGLGTTELPGQGTGENYPLPSGNVIPSSSLYQPQVYQQPSPYTAYPIVAQPDYGPTYGGLGGYSAYNPASSLYSQLYRPQNPYGQYGAFFQ
jgi:hypothetical protein